MLRFGASTTSLGVDIGNSSIKVVSMKKGPNGPQITGLAIEPLPQDAMVDGAINDSKFIADKIRKIKKDNNLPSDNCVTALAAQNAILRFIHFPVMPDEELQIAVRNEAEHYVPYPIEDVHIDFARLAEVEEEGMKRFLVLLVVSQRDFVCLLYTSPSPRD